MPYKYSAENHDWDLTLRAAWNLISLGHSKNLKSEQEFSLLTGGMLLSFCAIESFLASVAFEMGKNSERHKKFDYAKYWRVNNFWDRMRTVFAAFEVAVDLSKEPFHSIEEMRSWRVLLVHTKPYRIEPTEVERTDRTSHLHDPFRHLEYTKQVKKENAESFYKTALAFVSLLKETSGLEPHAMAIYSPVAETGAS